MNWLGEVVYLVSCRRGRPGPEITSLVPAQAVASGYHLRSTLLCMVGAVACLSTAYVRPDWGLTLRI